MLESQPAMIAWGDSGTGFGLIVMLTPPGPGDGLGVGFGVGVGVGVGVGLGVGVGVGSGDVGEVLPHATAKNRAARQTRKIEYARLRLIDFIAMDSPLLAKTPLHSSGSLASKRDAVIGADGRRGVFGQKQRPLRFMDEKAAGRCLGTKW